MVAIILASIPVCLRNSGVTRLLGPNITSTAEIKGRQQFWFTKRTRRWDVVRRTTKEQKEM